MTPTHSVWRMFHILHIFTASLWTSLQRLPSCQREEWRETLLTTYFVIYNHNRRWRKKCYCQLLNKCVLARGWSHKVTIEYVTYCERRICHMLECTHVGNDNGLGVHYKISVESFQNFVLEMGLGAVCASITQPNEIPSEMG